MKVKVIWECDIDIKGLDPEFINIKEFAKEEAKRFFINEIENNQISIEDLKSEI